MGFVKYLIIGIFLILILITTGCISNGDTTKLSNTNQSAPISTTIITVNTNENLPKYQIGAKIQKSPESSDYNPDHAYVILKINDDGTYNIGQIYKELYKDLTYDLSKEWYKIDGENSQIKSFHATERLYPVLLGNVNWETFPIKYVIKNPDGGSSLSWNKKIHSYENSYKLWTVGYSNLFRNIEQYIGSDFTISGKVIQAQFSGNVETLRISTEWTPSGYGYNDIIYVDYNGEQGRILERDDVMVTGEIIGLKTYTSTLGTDITVPHVLASQILVTKN